MPEVRSVTIENVDRPSEASHHEALTVGRELHAEPFVLGILEIGEPVTCLRYRRWLGSMAEG